MHPHWKSYAFSSSVFLPPSALSSSRPCPSASTSFFSSPLSPPCVLRKLSNLAPRRRAIVTSTATNPIPSTKQDESPAPSPRRESGADFRWDNRWYPIAWDFDVLPNKLLPIFLFGHRLVLFRDDCTGIYVVMDDMCPHRKAPLSDGRLYKRTSVTGEEKTVLECTYHGWKFSCNGTCIDVPHAEKDRKLSPETSVSSVYATTVAAFGLIFMWYGDRLLADESKLPVPQRVLDGPDNMVPARPMVRRFPISSEYVAQNLLDPAHVGFAHHGTPEGNRDFVPRNLNMRAKVEDGSDGHLVASFGLKGAPMTILDVSLLQGILIHYEIYGLKGGAPSLNTDFMLYVVPSERNTTTVFVTQVTYNANWISRTFLALVPMWIEHCYSNLVFDGDSPLIQHQAVTMGARSWTESAEGQKKYRFVMSESSLDCLVAVFHTWFDQAKRNMPFDSTQHDNSLQPYLPCEVVNDRYKWHTKDCHACSIVLRNLRVTMWVSVGVMVTAIATGMAAAVMASCSTGMGMGLKKAIATCMGLAIVAACMALAARKGIKGLTYTDKALRLQKLDSPAADMNSEEFRISAQA